MITGLTQFEAFFAERLYFEERRSAIVRNNLPLKTPSPILAMCKVTYQTKNLEAVIREYLKNLLARVHAIVQTGSNAKQHMPEMLTILHQSCAYLCNNLAQRNFLHSKIMTKFYEKEFETVIYQDPVIESLHLEVYNSYVGNYDVASDRQALYDVIRYRNHIWRVNSDQLTLRDKYYDVFLGRMIPDVKDLFEQLKDRLSSQENLIKSLDQVTKYLIELQSNLRRIFPISYPDMNRILEFIFQHCFNQIEKFTILDQKGFTSLLLDLSLTVPKDVYLYSDLLETLSKLTSFIPHEKFLPLFERICDEHYEQNVYLLIEAKILNLSDHKSYIDLACEFIDLLELDEVYTRFNAEPIFRKRTITNPVRKWIEKLVNQYHDKIVLSIASFINLFSLTFFEADKSIKLSIIERYIRRLKNREQFWAKVGESRTYLKGKYFMVTKELEDFYEQRRDVIFHGSPTLPILIQTLAVLKFLPKFDRLTECLHHIFSRDHLFFENFTESPKESYLALSSTFHDLFTSELRKVLNEMISDIDSYLPWSLSSSEYEDIKTKFTGSGAEFRIKKAPLEDTAHEHLLRLASYKTLHCDRVKFNEEFEKYLHHKCVAIDDFNTRDAVVNTLYSSVKIQLALPVDRTVSLLVTLNQLAVLNKFSSFEDRLPMSELIDGFVYEENGMLSVQSLVDANLLMKNNSVYSLNREFGVKDSCSLLTPKARKHFYSSSLPYYDMRIFVHNLMRHLISDIQALLGNSKKYVENFRHLLQAQVGSVPSQKYNKVGGETLPTGKLSILESYHTMRLREMICRVLKKAKILSGISNVCTLVNQEVCQINMDRAKNGQPEVKQFQLSEVTLELAQLVNIGMLENEVGERYSFIV